MTSSIKNLLADRGYNLVALPKSDIAPLDLLSREGDHVSPLGSPLDMLFEPDLAPLPRTDSAVASFSGQKAFEFDLKTNLGFLGGLFQAIGLDEGDLRAKANGGRTLKVEFSFDRVQEDKASLLDLDNYLVGATPLEKEFRTYAERLRRSELYVITAVLKSSAFSIVATDESGAAVGFDASVKPFAEGKVSIDRRRDAGFSIVHRDGPELVFAFKAAQILYEKTSWLQFWKTAEAGFRIKNQIGLVLKGVETFPIQPLLLGDQPAEL